MRHSFVQEPEVEGSYVNRKEPPQQEGGADDGSRTHTLMQQILNLPCLPFHHIRIMAEAAGFEPSNMGVKVPCHTI